MRYVDIVFDKRRVLPGETLSGSVAVKTDKAFECNRVVLKIVSRERTEVGAGDNRRVESKRLVSRVFRLSAGRTIDKGTIFFPFSYKVPRWVPPSYKGRYGDIKHTVEGVIEVNWALDPKKKEEYRVIQARPLYVPEVIDASTPSESANGLHIRLNEACLRLDSGILVNFKVDNRKRMRGVRFEIRMRERAKCGWSKVKHDRIIRRKYYELRPDDWGRWKQIRIGEDWKHHIPFRSQLFAISYHLRVILEIGWDMDPEIIIPLTLSDSAPEQDVFDEIAKDVGFEDW